MDQQTPDQITTFAQKFSINTDKPFFPVNTMRLFYLILTDGMTKSNAQATDQVNAIIPKITAVFDARDQFLADNQDTNPLLEIQACQTALNDIFALANTPVVHHTFDLLFSDLYPLQENLLISLDKHLNEDLLSTNDLYSILKIRAMDSVVYSTIIYQIIRQHLTDPSGDPLTSTNYQTSPIHWQINLTLQINDLVDAVIHAKEDVDSGSATIIDIIKKIIKDPTDLEETINTILAKLQEQSNKLPFPQPLQQQVKSFNTKLITSISANQTNA